MCLAYSIALLLLHLSVAGSSGSGWYGSSGYGSSGYGYPGQPRVTTRVTYEEPAESRIHVTHEVHHVLRRKKPRKQLVTVVQADPVAIVPAEPVAVLADGYQPSVGYEGSYVAVSGTPGRGSVHVVESGRCQLHRHQV